MSSPSAIEQLFLEYMNRFRADPEGEYDRLIGSRTDIDAMTAFFGVDLEALDAQLSSQWAAAPLAWSTPLSLSAEAHSQAMINADAESTNVIGSRQFEDRMTGFGYTDWLDIGENVHAFSDNTWFTHAQFVIDWGYDSGDRNEDNSLKADWKTLGDGINDGPRQRDAILNGSYSEVGVGVIRETDADTEVGEYVITQHFGLRWDYAAQFVGVVIDDADGDSFYDIGEGMGGVTVTLRQGETTLTTTTWDSGGYQIEAGLGEWEITFSGGGLTEDVVKTATMSAENVKVDAINPEPPNSAPVVSIDDLTVSPFSSNSFVDLADIMTVTDADGDTITRYQLFDDQGRNSWYVAGRLRDATAVYEVTAGEAIALASDHSASEQRLGVRAFDGTDWSDWESFTFTTLENLAPELTIPRQIMVAGSAPRPLTDFVTISNEDGQYIEFAHFRDAGGLDHATGGTSNFVTPTGTALVDGYTSNSIYGILLRPDPGASEQTLAIRVSDRWASSAWQEFTLVTVAADAGPLVHIETVTLSLDEDVTSVALADVIILTGFDEDAVIRYQLWDSEGGDNWQVAGEAVDASSGYGVSDLADIRIAADDAASTQGLWLRAGVQDEWSEWTKFDLVTTAASAPPVVDLDTVIVTLDGALSERRLSDLDPAWDINGDEITIYQLWDSEGGHNWKVDGEIITKTWDSFDASADIRLIADETPGEQTLWLRAFDGNDWGLWDDFTLITRESGAAPVVSIDDQVMRVVEGEWRKLEDVITVTDAEGDTITAYELRDTGGLTTSFLGANSWWADDKVVDATSGFVTTDLGNVWFRRDGAASEQTLSVRASDGNLWSAWEDFTLTTLDDGHRPVTTVQDVTMALDPLAWLQMQDLITVSDTEGDAIVEYEVRDATGMNNFWVGDRIVDASEGARTTDLSSIWVRPDAAASVQTLSIRARDEGGWGAWDQFNLTTEPENVAPVVTGQDITMLPDEVWIKLDRLVDITDADGDAITKVELWDDAGEDNWWVHEENFVDASAGFETDQVGAIWVGRNNSEGHETLWVRASDGEEWSAWESFELSFG